MNSYGHIFNSSMSTVSICQPNIEPILIGTEYFDYTYHECEDPIFNIATVQPSIQSYGNNIFMLSNPYRRVPLYYYEPNSSINQTSFNVSSTNFQNNRILPGSVGQNDLSAQQANSFSTVNKFYDETCKSQNQINYQNLSSFAHFQHDQSQNRYPYHSQTHLKNYINDDQKHFKTPHSKASNHIPQRQLQYKLRNKTSKENPHFIQNSRSQRHIQQASSKWESIRPVESLNIGSSSSPGYLPEKFHIKAFSGQNVLVDNGPQPVVQPALNALIKPSTESDFCYTDKYQKINQKSKTRRPGNPEVIAEFIEVLDQTNTMQEFKIVDQKNVLKYLPRNHKDNSRIAYNCCDYYDSSDCYESSSSKNYPVKTRYFDYTKNDYDSGFETYDKYSI